MPVEWLLRVLGGAFLLILCYVAWLKFYEHLHLHRNDSEPRHHHHLAAVRHFRTKRRKRAKETVDRRAARR